MSANRQVLLTGGGPWGLKLNGGKDFCSPIVVSKVNPTSKAARGGVRDGDYVLAINDTPTDDLKHHDAQALIRGTGDSLHLTVSNVSPKRPTAAVDTAVTTTAPVTRPAPPTVPVTTSHSTPTPPKVVHTTGGVTINVQKSRPTPPKPTNPASVNVTTPPSSTRPAPPPSRPQPPASTVTPAAPSVTTTPPPAQPFNKEGGVITDSILTDETDLNQSTESTLQSPAFRRITITEDDNTPHPATVIKPPVIGQPHHTPPPPSATVTKGILKSPVKPAVTKPPSQPKLPPAKPATVAGINRPAPPPVTVVKAPPQPTQDVGTKKDYDRQAECAKCNDPIRGPYATAMGSNWHRDCFCCSSCSQALSNVTFVIEGNDVYCEQCYKQGVAPICEGCQQAITGNYKSAMGRYWHGEHFVCSQCGTQLSGGDEGGFHCEEGRLFCPKCFTINYGVECFGCKQLIGGNELWIEAMDQNWHPECFVCVGCRNPLEGGSFFVKAGSPYCSNCK